MKDPHDTQTLEIPFGEASDRWHSTADLDDRLAREGGFDLGPCPPSPVEAPNELAVELEVVDRPCDTEG